MKKARVSASPALVLVLASVVAFAVTVAGTASGEPPAAATTTDEALIRDLLGERPESPESRSPGAADRPPAEAGDAPKDGPSALSDVGGDLREATRLLAEGQTGDPTRRTQQSAIDGFQRLIDAARQRPSASGEGEPSGDSGETDSPAPAEPSGPQAAQPSDASGRDGIGSPAADRPGKADESSERAGDAGGAGAIRDLRSDLIRGEWGHLPPNLRQRLLNGGADRYLPEYDGLARRYFESLARPSDGP